jgi:type II restriction/modification system DNA methylase subunit YeeA
MFLESDVAHLTLGFLNCKAINLILSGLSPTLDYRLTNLSKLPLPVKLNMERRQRVEANTHCLVGISRYDWDAYETSWNFTTLPLLAPDNRVDTLEATYSRLRGQWQQTTDEMRALEEENNRIFIDAYGLQDELTPEVPIEEITLTCNPAYSIGGNKTSDQLEDELLSRTIQEFLHYAVGCMFGRYSLDAPGLILANQGEGLADYLARVPNPTFPPDADNVIPVLDGDWFADDITERFRKFLRVTFGEAKFQENLAFIEAALGRDIRKWFTKDFFDYHVRRYKKRPIYWMFSSPKGTFNALIYMHRYRPDTVSVVLNDYLRELISKLKTERARLEKLSDDPSASQTQRTRALRDVGAVIKQITELEEWERDVVFPLAQAKIEIDLDDGVKQNYPKFGAALKPIKGLEATDD